LEYLAILPGKIEVNPSKGIDQVRKVYDLQGRETMPNKQEFAQRSK
jgi:hypothetical protein